MTDQTSVDAFCKTGYNDLLWPDVYTSLFSQQLEHNNCHEALNVLLQNPSKEKQSMCLRQLLQFLSATGRKTTLVELDYGHLTDVVEEILEDNCLCIPARKAEEMYDLVNAFHFRRYNFGKSARAMYEYADRLRQEGHTKVLLEKRCAALVVAHVSAELAEREEKSWADSKNIYGDKKPTVTKEEISREQVIADALLELPNLSYLFVPSVSIPNILAELMKNKKYDKAMLISCIFDLPPYNILQEVTFRSMLADQKVLSATEYRDFVSTNKKFIISFNGKVGEHWKLIRSYVEICRRHWPSDARILRTVTDIFLGCSVKIPKWLETPYKEVNFGDFVRSLIDFGELEEAFKHILPGMDEAITKVIAGNLHDVIVPYTHIDVLLYLARNSIHDYSELIRETQQRVSKFNTLCESIRKISAK